jgi:predicted Zn-ribbon and HTH transcriptional regulator
MDDADDEEYPERRTVTVRRRPSSCPQCGSQDIAELIWGLIDDIRNPRFQNHNIIFAGCCVTSPTPKWRCRGCGTDFVDERDPDWI